MHLSAIPRHQIEISAGDYARMLGALPRTHCRQREVRRFESLLADYVGCRHAIAVASARLGLHLVFKHLNLEPGAEVVTPAFNLFAVVERILGLGLRPVFADIHRADLTVDASDINALITSRTGAILATHMFGHPCDMDALTDLASRNDLALVEDCAHAFGSLYRGRHVGTFGRAGVFSLSPMKLITSFGGGVITTNDDKLADSIRTELKMHGMVPTRFEALRRFAKGTILDLGTRTLPFSAAAWPALRIARAAKPDVQQRMMTETPARITSWNPYMPAFLDTFQAVLGRSQVARAHRLIRRRLQVAEWLDDGLQHVEGVTLLRRRDHVNPNGLYYGVLVDQPDRLSNHLFTRGIDSETSEYRNCAALDIYRDFRRNCPVSVDVEWRILRIPNHPRLSLEDVRRIAREIQRFVQTTPATQGCPAVI